MQHQQSESSNSQTSNNKWQQYIEKAAIWFGKTAPALVAILLLPPLVRVFLHVFRRLPIMFARQSDVEFQKLTSINPEVKKTIRRRVHRNNVKLGLYFRFVISWTLVLQNTGRIIAILIIILTCVATPIVAISYYNSHVAFWTLPFLIVYVISLCTSAYCQHLTVDWVRRFFRWNETIQDRMTGAVYSVYSILASIVVSILHYSPAHHVVSIFAAQCGLLTLWGFWIAWYAQSMLFQIGMRIGVLLAKYFDYYKPDLLVAQSLQTIIYSVERNPRSWGSLEMARRLCSQLEECAKLIEQGFPQFLGQTDTNLQRLYSDRAKQMALGLRDTIIWTLVPKPDTREQFLTRISFDYICAASGQWDSFTMGGSQSSMPVKDKLSRIMEWLRHILVIVIPPLACYSFHLMRPKVEIPPYIIAPIVIWISGGLLYLIEGRS